ncbi:MAG TPA: PEGA domain-containing protein, partial [Polyangia bacterium]
PAAPVPARSPAQPVLVRITSSPLGAVVRTKKQVLGRTPIAIRFNPGNTYKLTFVKKGYVTSNRMVPVASGKPQSISVPMKKAAAPTRRISIFRGR